MKVSATGQLLLAVLCPVLLCGCSGIVPDKIDLLATPGAEKLSEMPHFRPFSEIVKPYGSSWLITNPDREQHIVTALSGVKLDPTGIYELKMRYAGQEGTRLILNGLEYGDGKIIKRNTLLNTVSFLNVNGMTAYSKEFAVTPECRELVPSLSILRPGKNGNLEEFLVEELSIRRVGDMKKAAPEVKKVNLASDYDFSEYPEGDFKKIHKGNGADAKKWTDIKAEIVTLDGEKVLHIVRTPENYIYPFMNLKKFPIDPKYHFVKVSFKAKGTGSILPGLWWDRASLHWDYYHLPEVSLSDRWQTVTFLHPCMTSDVRSATMSFTSSGSGEFWIKDISVNLE